MCITQQLQLSIHTLNTCFPDGIYNRVRYRIKVGMSYLIQLSAKQRDLILSITLSITLNTLYHSLWLVFVCTNIPGVVSFLTLVPCQTP